MPVLGRIVTLAGVVFALPAAAVRGEEVYKLRCALFHDSGASQAVDSDVTTAVDYMLSTLRLAIPASAVQQTITKPTAGERD